MDHPDMETIEGAELSDKTVRLGGKRWLGCTFTNCTVMLWAEDPPTVLINNNFVHCKIVGTGWPDGFPVDYRSLN